MAISDKTRKILWARSGNRCAECRRQLVEEATQSDAEAVVGDECHIVSGQPQGPRYNASFLAARLDEPDNLILLCRVHHKIVDDQTQTYTVEALQKLKATHEAWVASTLNPSAHPLAKVRIRRVKENIPAYLPRLTSGKDVLNIIQNAYAHAFDHDEPASEDEMQLLAEFFQEAQDYGDLYNDLDAGPRVKTAFRMSDLLRQLEDAGFWVFGGREIQRLEGGIGGPEGWPVVILHVVRSTSPEIIKLNAKSESSD
jgi:hypothetical protein